MTDTDAQLERLDNLLYALPQENYPMTLSELDGYVTGLLICSEVTPASDWLPQVWGETADGPVPEWQIPPETVAAVTAHYNTLAEALSQSPWIEPIYEEDPETEDTLWDAWMDGFARGLRLQPDAWQRLIEGSNQEATAALVFLMALQEINEGSSTLSDEEIEDIQMQVFEMIPNCVAAILPATRPALFVANASRIQ